MKVFAVIVVLSTTLFLGTNFAEARFRDSNAEHVCNKFPEFSGYQQSQSESHQDQT